MEKLTLQEARRLALAAQGFATPRLERPVTAQDIIRTIERIGLLQIDSVNVLVRSHYLPLFSRLGNYDQNLLHQLVYQKPHRLFEYWGHEASILPISAYSLLRWRMQEWNSHA